MNPWRTATTILMVSGGVVAILAASLTADGRKDAKPSSYAPANDLQDQTEMFIERIEKDLGDKEDFGEDQQNRVSLDASTLIVLAQILGMHDDSHPLTKSASPLFDAASELSECYDDFDAATEALAKIKAAVSATDGKKLEFEPVADLQLLMMQVPIINNSLRRGVSGRRFARSLDRNAGYAATLAAIAQASLADTSYCADAEDEAKWAKICADMRDASAAVNAAIRKKDQDAAKQGLATLVETCDACHHAFRD